MDVTEEEPKSRSGIKNYDYDRITNVINVSLKKEDVAVFGSGNNIADTINSIIKPFTKSDHEQ